MHKDVPRLLKGMLVIGPQGERLYVDDGTAKPSDPPAQVTPKPNPNPNPNANANPTPQPPTTPTLTPTPTPTLSVRPTPAQIAAIRSLLLALSRALDGEAATQHIEAVLLTP